MSPDEISDLTKGCILQRQAQSLSEVLRKSSTASIDAMLEHRRDLRVVGKQLIAAMILRCEAKSVNHPDDSQGDWFSWIFERMATDAASATTFSRQPVSFVTFNYDRLLEHRFFGSIEAHYNPDPSECRTALDRLRIIHLHGRIGSLTNTDPITNCPAIPYGDYSNSDESMLSYAMNFSDKNIKIIHESVQDSEEFSAAKELLRAADQVVFLGFGFAPTNVRRLALGDTPVTTHVYCSTLGMESAEVQSLIRDVFPHGTATPPAGKLLDCEGCHLQTFLRRRTSIAH